MDINHFYRIKHDFEKRSHFKKFDFDRNEWISNGCYSQEECKHMRLQTSFFPNTI